MRIVMATWRRSCIKDRPTGYLLARMLGATVSKRARRRGDVLIRYGLAYNPEADRRFKVVINRAEAIVNARNKLRALRIMASKGVVVPPYFTSKYQIAIEDLPVLARSYSHTRGSDIVYIDSMEKLWGTYADYYTQYIPAKHEYRVHVFNGEPIRLQKKIAKAEDASPIIKNAEHGYILADNFKYTSLLKRERKVINAATRAVEALGLDFGAVDVLYYERTPYVLEVNTAPALDSYGLQLYALIISQFLGLNPKLESFPLVELSSSSLIKYRRRCEKQV